ncbi:DUF1801 domain-containing protein, partial [Candidatus Berkelbacteria bacterium]|nr:DUF1801 domain-containing protein [Candidatus Berkelbacteria bacterium]
MAEIKTKKSKQSVADFIASITDEQRRLDSEKVLKIISEETGEQPVMWGDSIVGFGTYKYINSAGQENEWMATGFSPRKQALTLYIMPGYGMSKDLLKKLGKHSTGKA